MNTQIFVLKSKIIYFSPLNYTCPPAFDEVVRHALGSDHLTPVVGTRNFLLRIQNLVLCHCNLDLIKKYFQRPQETKGLHLWLSVTVKYTNYKEVLREGYCMMPLNQQIELGLYFSIMLTILLGYALGGPAVHDWVCLHNGNSVAENKSTISSNRVCHANTIYLMCQYYTTYSPVFLLFDRSVQLFPQFLLH